MFYFHLPSSRVADPNLEDTDPDTTKKIQDPEPTYIGHDPDPTSKPGSGFCPTGKPEIRSATLPGVLFLDFITYRPRITSESDQTSQEGNFSLFFFNQDKKSDNNIF